MNEERKKVLIIGVIGADVHAVGNKILYHAFTEAGFDVVNLGVMVSQEEYIEAAIEADADAIVVSSLYGQGELDCRGMREKCDEAGLAGIPSPPPRLSNPGFPSVRRQAGFRGRGKALQGHGL